MYPTGQPLERMDYPLEFDELETCAECNFIGTACVPNKSTPKDTLKPCIARNQCVTLPPDALQRSMCCGTFTHRPTKDSFSIDRLLPVPQAFTDRNGDMKPMFHRRHVEPDVARRFDLQKLPPLLICGTFDELMDFAKMLDNYGPELCKVWFEVTKNKIQFRLNAIGKEYVNNQKLNLLYEDHYGNQNRPLNPHVGYNIWEQMMYIKDQVLNSAEPKKVLWEFPALGYKHFKVTKQQIKYGDRLYAKQEYNWSASHFDIGSMRKDIIPVGSLLEVLVAAQLVLPKAIDIIYKDEALYQGRKDHYFKKDKARGTLKKAADYAAYKLRVADVVLEAWAHANGTVLIAQPVVVNFITGANKELFFKQVSGIDTLFTDGYDHFVVDDLSMELMTITMPHVLIVTKMHGMMIECSHLEKCLLSFTILS